MSEPTNTKTASPPPGFSLDWMSTDSWAVSAAVIFILLVVAGVFPHVSW
jgi:hypothetical protein